MIMGYQETYKQAIDTYGHELQIIVAIEEMSELTKELCKRLRGKDNIDAIAEEIADVQIMLAQLQIIFDCSSKIHSYRAAKIARLQERLEEHKKMDISVETNSLEILVRTLRVGDKVRINDWEEFFTVCGVSDNYVLAHKGDEYTIIAKNPTRYAYNGIPWGAYVCGPDYFTFGYPGGYSFADATWVSKYLADLEHGSIEMSTRNRAQIHSMEREVGGNKRHFGEKTGFAL